MSIRSILSNKIKSLEKDFDVYNHIYISKSALLNNFDLLRQFSPSRTIIPVLKSNAYGHGLEQVAEILKTRSFPYIAVDGYFEALKIRQISKQPVLIMGAIDPKNYSKINPQKFTFVVHDKATIEAMGKSQKRFLVHVEIETGMNRHGVKPKDLNNFIKLIKKYPNITVEGVMSHLADADNPTDTDFTAEQVAEFDKAVETVLKHDITPKFIHIAQSAGCTKIKSKYANTIRTGLALYGFSPLSKADPFSGQYKQLLPVLSMDSTLTKIQNVAKDDSVSYSRTYIAKHKTKIGVIPFGYYEGLPRSLSDRGLVKIFGNYYRIAGRICMNHTMIDLKDTNLATGNSVNLISHNSKDKNSAINLSKKYNLFIYEFLTNLNQNIRRTIVD